MKRIVLFLSLLFWAGVLVAQDKTLRVNYIFAGNNRESHIFLDDMNVIEGWAGRRVNMKDLYLQGNGQLLMTDAESGDTLYRNSFSTLFQEWQSTEQATQVNCSYENVFLLPMPTQKAIVTVTLSDTHNRQVARLEHMVDPTDILIKPIGQNPPKWQYLHQGGSNQDCIDVVILPEGYTIDQLDKFHADAQTAVKAILSHAPFDRYADRFNFIAVDLPSQDSDASNPKTGQWKNTALSSNYSTFYSDRYLTTKRVRQLHDQIAGVPYEHIIILANTAIYGGGGIFNSYTLTTANHADFEPVVVHEFGHSFGGLADEYYYDDQYEQYYNSQTEPWEPNLTTGVDFASKWQDMIPSKVEQPTPVPVNDPRTPMTDKQRKAVSKLPPIGYYEGGGYMSKGVWRGSFDCRMHTNSYYSFCPVCQRSLERLIRFYTEGGYHIE